MVARRGNDGAHGRRSSDAVVDPGNRPAGDSHRRRSDNPPGAVRARAPGARDVRNALQVRVMAGRGDRAKGRVKESLGALADHKRLKDKGRVDQAKGSTKKRARRAADKLT